jgi:hypothetical protein
VQALEIHAAGDIEERKVYTCCDVSFNNLGRVDIYLLLLVYMSHAFTCIIMLMHVTADV